MAHALDHEEFVGNPSVAELKSKKVNKEQLKYIAREFGIGFSYDTRKDDLMTLILAHLGEDKVTETREVSPVDGSLALEIEKVKLAALRMQMEHEKQMQLHSQEHEKQM